MEPQEVSRTIGECTECRQPVKLGPWGDGRFPFGFLEEMYRDKAWAEANK
jgi:hypothetical protein